MENSGHVPVMLNEVLQLFSEHQGEPRALLDGTFGRGGHCRALLDAFPALKATGVDRDEAAHEHARRQFSSELETGRLRLFHGSYRQFAQALTDGDRFDFILLDLGVSSPQLDDPERGFSFYGDGPLDMRMGRGQKTTAADVINTWPEEDLIEIFKTYGEVRSPYRVVRAIVHDRKTEPYTTTRQLAGLIERVEGWRQKGRHPATQYFLALRLVVNTELEDLTESLPVLLNALNDGGIMVVITFHSLEDRIVKTAFKEREPAGRRMNKKVIVPSEEELARNPRSRSAKVRGFMKTPLEAARREKYRSR